MIQNRQNRLDYNRKCESVADDTFFDPVQDYYACDHCGAVYSGKPPRNPLMEFVRDALGLSANEAAVLDAVRGYQMPKTAAKISVDSGVDRQAVIRILKDFERRKIVFLRTEPNAHPRWRYNKKLSRLCFRTSFS